MDHFVQRLAVSKQDEFGPFGDNADYIYSAKYCPLDGYKQLLCMTNEGGYLAVQETGASAFLMKPEKKIRSVKVHGNAVFDSVWLDKPNSIVTVSGDQTARLFDINTCDESKPITAFVQHSRSVKTVDAEPTRRVVFASGSRDGSICIWDSRVTRSGLLSKPENRIVNAHTCSENRLRRMKSHSSYIDSGPLCSVTAVLYQDEYKLISSGSGDGFINVWDLRRNYTVYSSDPLPCEQLSFPGTSTRRGYSSLALNRGQTRLFANCTDGTVYEWNVASYSKEPVNRYSGHLVGSFHVKCDISPDDEFLVSGSSDNFGYIWSTKCQDGKPLAKLDGHGAEVTAVAWSKLEDLTLVTCSDDYNHRIWRYHPLSALEENKNDYRCRAEPIAKPKNKNLITKALGLNLKHYMPCVKRPLSLCVQRALENRSRASPKRKLSEDDIDANRIPLSPKKDSNSPVKFVPKIIKLEISSSAQIAFSFDKDRLSPMVQESKMNVTSVASSDLSSDVPDGLEIVRRYISPKKRCYSEPSSSTPRTVKPTATALSPTVNLPNYVVDGRSPSRLSSGQKKKSSNWLSDMQRVKNCVTGERKRVVRHNSRGKEIKQESLQKYFRKM